MYVYTSYSDYDFIFSTIDMLYQLFEALVSPTLSGAIGRIEVHNIYVCASVCA